MSDVMIRAGDTVRHRPSGETWVIAAVDRGEAYACGWPCTRARLEVLELVEAASEQEHEAMLFNWSSRSEGDPRELAARAERARRTVA